MASTVILPPKQRGLKHVDQILARNLPKLTKADCLVTAASGTEPSTGPTANTQSPSPQTPEKVGSDSDEDVVPCSTYYTLTHLPTKQCPCTEELPPFYTSAVEFGQQQPGWNLLSTSVRQHHATRVLFTIYAQRRCVLVDTTSSSNTDTSSSSGEDVAEDELSGREDSGEQTGSGVVILQAVLDLGKMMFVTKSLSQLHELHDLPHVSTLPGKAGQIVLLVKCHDGVFCPILEDPKMLGQPAHQLASQSPQHSRQPSNAETPVDGRSVSSTPPSPRLLGHNSNHQRTLSNSVRHSPAAAPLESPNKGAVPAPTATSNKLSAAVLPREESTWEMVDGDVVKEEERRTTQRVEVTTLGDFTMLSSASLAIHRMRQIAKYQRDHLQGRIQQYVLAREAVSKIAAKKQATHLRCENLRERIEATKFALTKTKESHCGLEKGCAQRTENVEVDRRVLEERRGRCEDRTLGSRSELRHMRASVVKVQKQVVSNVTACFPIVANTICGYRVPDMEPETEEHAIALGLAAHLFQGYANTFGFHIPHPLYVCSSRSYICEHAAVIAEKRYPLFPSRSERPQMRKGIILLHGNISAAALGIHRRPLVLATDPPPPTMGGGGKSAPPAMHENGGSGHLTLLQALERLVQMEGPEVEPELFTPLASSRGEAGESSPGQTIPNGATHAPKDVHVDAHPETEVLASAKEEDQRVESPQTTGADNSSPGQDNGINEDADCVS